MLTPNAPNIWHVPYQRNPFFTGREDVLNQLHQTLHAETTVALSHPQGISGLGGIGKTQTALEYAYRYRAEYAAVIWVRADSRTALISSLVELAHVLELSERHEQDQELIVQAVLRWFRLHPDWLLIYDNIDNLSIAEPFLPKAGAGHLLFTTRVHAFGELAQRLDIQQMEPAIGALLLLRRANLLAIQAALDMATPDNQSIACAISQELDGLPLAIDQAGAYIHQYIKETSCETLSGLQQYLERYQTRRQELLQSRESVSQDDPSKDYPASVATTWSLSFEKVTRANPAAAELLDLCAFLAPDAIPEEMIAGGASYLGPPLQAVAADPLRFDQSIAALLAYSLIGRNADESILSVHRLVQVVLRDAMFAERKKQWMQRAVSIVNTAFPHAEFAQWTACERCLSHALVCATWIEQEQMVFPESARLLNQTGFYLTERAQYSEAKPLLRRALAIYEQLGPEHPDTATSLNNLALLYWNQGKYGQAEPLYQRALSIREQQSGLGHLDTARSLNNLAALYQVQGKYEQAEQLYQRALLIREQQLGPEHPDTAQSLNNLAEAYRACGKYKQAEPLYQRALAISEQRLGAEHPDTATGLSNLAELYQAWDKYELAEPLLKRALAILEKQLGPEHADTVSSLNNLANLYVHRGMYDQAELLYQRALTFRAQQLGAEHPDTATGLNNLAALYDHQGKYEQAEQLYQQALKILEQRSEPEHADIADVLNNLAELYQAQGEYEQAEPLYQRALEIREQKHGPEHPDTASSLNDLAAFYRKQGKYGEAEPLYQRVLTIYERVLGREHPTTQTVRENYASLLRAMRRDEEAKKLEEDS